jgi:hypothetical protein
MESHKIPWFQSPPTKYKIIYKYPSALAKKYSFNQPVYNHTHLNFFGAWLRPDHVPKYANPVGSGWLMVLAMYYIPMDPWPLSKKVRPTPQIIPQSHFLRRYGWIHRDWGMVLNPSSFK